MRGRALPRRGVRDGDYGVDIDVAAGDEIGMLSQAFQSLVGDLKEKARLVEYMTATAGAAPAEPPRSARPSPPRDALRPGKPFAHRYAGKEGLGAGGVGVGFPAFARAQQEPLAINALPP